MQKNQARSRHHNRNHPLPGLAALIHPLSQESFFKNYWPNKYAVVHGSPERLISLLSSPELKNVETLLRTWKGLVTVCCPSTKDEYNAVTVPPAEAEKLYDEGMNLIFGLAEEQIQSLRPWLAQLKTDLGLPDPINARCLVYASPLSEGAGWHFDQNVNFVVQICGTKIWWLAPNRHVDNPLGRYALSMPTVPEELSSYCKKQLPTHRPSKSNKIMLRPGSFLFVPRGWWHTTRSKEESLSLNFTFDQPTWSNLLLAGIRRQLIRFSHWRELADGAGGEGERAKEATRRLNSLLEHLFDDLGPLSAEELIFKARQASPITLSTRFKRAFRVHISASGKRAIVQKSGQKRTVFEIDPESTHLFHCLGRLNKAFTVADAEIWAPHLTPHIVTKILEALVEAGALERI